MGYDYASDVLGAESETPKTATINYDYASDILNPKSQTVSGADLVPHIRNNPERAASVPDLATASLADDPARRIEYFAKQRFPNEPDAVSRYGYDSRNGQIYYFADDGKIYSEDQPRDGIAQFAKRNVVGNAGKLIPLSMEIGAGIVTAPVNATGIGIVGSSAAVAGAGSLGETIRQFLGKRLLGDDVSGAEIVKEGAIAGAGQAVGGLFSRFGNRAVARDIQRLDQSNVDYLLQQADELGISLTPAELTNLRSLRHQQRTIARTPEGADILGDYLTNRNTVQIPRAKEQFLQQISPVDQTDVAAANLQQAGADITESTLKARTAAVTPEYQAVMKPSNVIPAGTAGKPAVYDTNGLLIKPEVKAVAGPFDALSNDKLIMSVVGKVKSDPVYREFHGMPSNSLPVLDQAKKILDDMIAVAKQDGKRNKARMIESARDKLVKTADEAFPDYAAARAKFETLSPEVNQVVNGSVGAVGKSSGKVGDTGIIFDFNRSGPIEVARARATFEKAGKIDEFNAGLRAFIQNKWAQATKETAAGPKGNVAGALRSSIFGDERARNVMKAAMSPEQYDSMTRLMNVLEAAGRAMPEGSATATDLTAINAMKGDAGKLWKWLTSPLSSVRQAAEDKAFSANAERLAKVITSPDAMSKLKELKKLSPTSVRAREIVSQVLVQALAVTPGEVLGRGTDLSPEDIRMLDYLSSTQAK